GCRAGRRRARRAPPGTRRANRLPARSGRASCRAYPTGVPALAHPLTPTQQRAVDHGAGALLVLGGAGSGKTTVLAERFAKRVRDGVPAEAILVLTPRGADIALRERIEDALGDAWGELSVHDAHALCARLLRDEAVEAGLNPIFVPATAADRLALLLDRVD